MAFFRNRMIDGSVGFFVFSVMAAASELCYRSCSTSPVASSAGVLPHSHSRYVNGLRYSFSKLQRSCTACYYVHMITMPTLKRLSDCTVMQGDTALFHFAARCHGPGSPPLPPG